MPEGHTIHRIAKYQRRLLTGHHLVVTSPQKRFTAGARLVSGLLLDRIEALGKHLFYHFGEDRIVHVHLGMHGRFKYAKFNTQRPPAPKGQIRMRLVTGKKVVDLSGPTACEVLDRSAVQSIRERIGPDLLSPHPDPEPAWTRIHRSRQAIALLLMDQSVLSGIGNAYRSELLYRQGLNPHAPGSSLSRSVFDKLWQDAINQLQLGVKLGIMVTVEAEDLTKPARKMVRRDRDRFYVYRRDTCLRCGAPVKSFEMGGRTVYACTKEQLNQQTGRRNARGPFPQADHSDADQPMPSRSKSAKSSSSTNRKRGNRKNSGPAVAKTKTEHSRKVASKRSTLKPLATRQPSRRLAPKKPARG